MHLGYVIIYVQDVVATVKFYEKAFELKCRFIHETNTYAEMETGQTAIAFVDEEMMKTSHSFRPNRTTKEPSGVQISLVTGDVQKKFDSAIKAGAFPLIKPTRKPWGQIVSYLRDNNGCLIEICTPITA